MKASSSLLAAASLVAGALACSTASLAAAPAEHYVAHLVPMNSQVALSDTTGEARFDIHGDRLTIDIRVKNAPGNIVHWQHFHGFTTDAAATCPTLGADTNGDHIVDLIETEPAAGTTMVPFDTMPAAMDVAHGHYPKAAADGSYHYHQTVSVKELSAAFAKAFKGQGLNLDKRVIFIHGVPADTKLPSTVKSLGPIPAAVTLPIACGKIERVSN
ncbi:hypothetical protein [Candidimonas nitroreducens]|uniref:CHRD domain-containing protein n=1 Tax=Candidimonas nitroreducens TaxID=683354 RepID=A0A225MD18_9BURK|nr:hypothetical protein [Candidimonas nitroreducens]OWT59187.1 hypothetical protein CEY11_13480 [Candidimonas nitroreducens]